MAGSLLDESDKPSVQQLKMAQREAYGLVNCDDIVEKVTWDLEQRPGLSAGQEGTCLLGELMTKVIHLVIQSRIDFLPTHETSCVSKSALLEMDCYNSLQHSLLPLVEEALAAESSKMLLLDFYEDFECGSPGQKMLLERWTLAFQQRTSHEGKDHREDMSTVDLVIDELSPLPCEERSALPVEGSPGESDDEGSSGKEVVTREELEVALFLRSVYSHTRLLSVCRKEWHSKEPGSLLYQAYQGPRVSPWRAFIGNPNRFNFEPVVLGACVLSLAVETMSALPQNHPAPEGLETSALVLQKKLTSTTRAQSGKSYDVLQKPLGTSHQVTDPQPSSVVVGFRTAESSKSGIEESPASASKLVIDRKAKAAVPKVPHTADNRQASSAQLQGKESSTLKQTALNRPDSFVDENSQRQWPSSKAPQQELHRVPEKRTPLSPLQRMLTDWQSIAVIDLDNPESDDLKLDTDSTSQEDEDAERSSSRPADLSRSKNLSPARRKKRSSASPKPAASHAIPIPIPILEESNHCLLEDTEEPSTSGRPEPISPPVYHYRQASPVQRRAAMTLSPLGPRSPLLAAVTSSSRVLSTSSSSEASHRSPPHSFSAGKPPVGARPAAKKALFSDFEEFSAQASKSNSLDVSSKLVARHLDPSPVEGSPLRDHIARCESAQFLRGGITPPQGGSWQELERAASLPPRGHRPGPGTLGSIKRSLVGSFEESLLSGRITKAAPAFQRLNGFQALLSVGGGEWTPERQKLPFSVVCVDGTTSLYCATIRFPSVSSATTSDGEQLRRNSAAKSTGEQEHAHHARLRVPQKGKVQLVLSNPERTPVHTFVCSYDLHDMPHGTKTFVRQKVSSLGLPNMSGEQVTCFSNGALLYALHMRFMCSPVKAKTRRSWPRSKQESTPEINNDAEAGQVQDPEALDRRRFYLYGDLRVVFPQRRSDADDVKLRVEYDSPMDPKYFPSV